jgi:hypothetical protein
MDRNEGRIRDQVSIWSEQSAGEIEALLDIRADSSLLEGSPHCLRDAHEAVGEERQENRIGTFGRRLVRMCLVGHSGDCGVPVQEMGRFIRSEWSFRLYSDKPRLMNSTAPSRHR